MRPAAVLLLALSAAFAAAQQNPLQPEGFRPPPGPTYDLGAPDPARRDDRTLVWKTFGELSGSGNTIRATGGVEFEYRGYNVRADEAEGDTETEQFVLRGNVTVRGADQVTTGEEIWVDFKEEKYRFLRGKSDFSPSFFQGALLSNLFATAASSEGSPQHVSLTGGGVTTCPLDHAHFGLYAGQIEVDPGDRIIFRDMRLRALGKTLIGLPHLRVPLDRKDYRGYMPDVGRSELEGVYVKSRFDANLLPGRPMTLRAEVMEKRGLGTGLEYRWGSGLNNGRMSLYNLFDQERGQNSQTGQFTHNQRFGGLSLTAQADMRRNSYLSFSESRALNGTLGLVYRDSHNNMRLDLRESRNENGSFSNENRTIGFTDNRALGGGFSLTSRVNYRSSTAQNQGNRLTDREEADMDFGLRYAARLFDGELSYRRLIPIGDTLNFRPSSERTPVLSLRSDTRRLFGLDRFPRVSIDTEFGQFLDNFTEKRVTREAARLRTSKALGTGRGWSVGYQSEFHQSFYSDDTAQYVLGQTLETRYGLSADERSQGVVLRYRYTRPYGYTPLSIDRRGQVNVLTTLWEALLGGGFTLRAGGGYDFLREQQGRQAWNTVGAALRYQPNDSLDAVVTSSYDPTDKLWSNTRIRAEWDWSGTNLIAEARYDARRQVWGNLNFRLEGWTFGRLKTSLLFLYNGYLKQFETRQVNLIYDLHCVEAVLSYRDTPIGYRHGKDIQFILRIKALPFSSDFGLGPAGQALDTSTGVDF